MTGLASLGTEMTSSLSELLLQRSSNNCTKTVIKNARQLKRNKRKSGLLHKISKSVSKMAKELTSGHEKPSATPVLRPIHKVVGSSQYMHRSLLQWPWTYKMKTISCLNPSSATHCVCPITRKLTTLFLPASLRAHPQPAWQMDHTIMRHPRLWNIAREFW